MMRNALALTIIRLATPAAHREFVVGDTLERAAELECAHGPKAASRWLWREAWRVAVRSPQHRLAVRDSGRRANVVGDGLLRTLWRDVRYTLRALQRAPLFTAIAVAMLALGIGANTAMFAVVHAVLLKPLPFAEPDRLMLVHLLMPQREGGAVAYSEMVWSYPKFRAFAEMQDVFEDAALFSGDPIDLTHVDEPEQLAGETITDRYLPALGIEPLLGRAFSADEAHVLGTPAVALIGDQLWARRFARDPAIVGRTIHLDRQPYTVVGVLPPGFRGLTGEAEVWVPQAAFKPFSLAAAQAHGYQLVARRRAGVTEQAARDAVRVFGERIDERFRTDFDTGRWSAGVVSLSDARIDPDIRTTTLLLLAGVSFVLLIACANLAALLGTRSLARHREVAIRLAIGADNRQIVRQLLVDVVVLVGFGAIAGGVVALGLLSAATALLPDAETFFRVRDSLVSPVSGLTRVGAGMIGIDAMTFTFAAGISLACAALIVILPARQASSAQPIEALKTGAARAAPRARLRDPLVVTQIALALVLLAGAGLMLKSVWRLQETGAGIAAENIVAVRVNVPSNDAAPQAQLTFLTQLLERVRALPGIESAALGSCVPASGGCARAAVSVDEPWQPGRGMASGVYMVSETYFETLGVRLLAGRVFSDRDYALQPRAVLVNEAAAQAFWPGRDPVGAKVATFGLAQGVEVVGVVSNVRYRAIETPPEPDIYLPLSQLSLQPSRLPVFVRSRLEPAAIVAMIRAELRTLDPNVTLTDATTMEERLSNAIWRTRLTAWLLGAFAVLAVLLTAIGIFGLMAQVVAQRSGELAVRIALGARGSQVLRLVLRRVVVMTLVGLAIGVAGALALARVVGALLYDVPGNDPTTLVSVAVGLGAVALAAGYFPARRAVRVDPMATLKSE